jgi:hypothetical protein
MSVDPAKVVLYCQDTFDIANPNQAQYDAMVSAAQDIAASGFGTVLLGQWHVHEDGGIYYNDSPLDSVMKALTTIPAILTQGHVGRVLISFGPFAKDFHAIKDNLDEFTSTMDGVQKQSGVDGYDWDLEGDYGQFADLLVGLTEWAGGQGLMTTAAPYEEMRFWTEVLRRTQSGGAPGFAWWNLQLYGGADYGSWVDGLQGIVADPQSFLVPGYAVHLGATPDTTRTSLAQLVASYPDLSGAFIWQYEDILKYGYSAAQFANAIVQGLGEQRLAADLTRT